jgi:hypothetical protein
MDTSESVRIALRIGDEIKTTLGTLVLDDYVPVEASSYQYDEGYWAYSIENESLEYFVSTDGSVYGESADRKPMRIFDQEIGRVIS